MSHTGTTPIKNENHASMTVPNPVIFPMVPMFFPYVNNNSIRQPYLPPAVCPNVRVYPSINNYHNRNIAMGYNTPYETFYPTLNNISSHNLLYVQENSQLSGNDVKRNQHLNIRECQSPSIDPTTKSQSLSQNIDPSNISNNTHLGDYQYSSPVSSPTYGSKSNSNYPSSVGIQQIDSDNPSDDFLTFIEQKTEIKRSIPELNPFANEFFFDSNKTVTKDSAITSNCVNHDKNHENQSSYRVLFDNLIEKSLESIEIIKKIQKKKIIVNDASVQCNQTSGGINRSTQTKDSINNSDLLEEYSFRTIKLLDQLLEHFRNIYQEEFHKEFKTLANTCDELRHLILFNHHIISLSSNTHKENRFSVNLDNSFNRMLEDLVSNKENRNRYRISSQIKYNAEHGQFRVTACSTLPVQSFDHHHIDQVEPVRLKLCLICQRPLDQTDDTMHILCQSLFSDPIMCTDA